MIDDFLFSVPLFAEFDAAELADILLAARRFRVEAGVTLMHQGDPADGMLLLKSGSVHVSARVPGDEVVELGAYGAGAILGEVGLLDRGTRSANVVTATPVTGYHFDAARFEMLRSDLRPAAFRFMERVQRAVAARIRAAIMQVASAPLPVRLREHQPISDTAELSKIDDRANSVRMVLSDSQLRALPCFSNFTAAEVDEFLARTDCQQIRRGAVLYTQNSRPRHLFVVLRGALRSSVARSDRREQLAIFGPGRLAGLVAMVDEQPHPAACDAREETLLLAVDESTFHELRQGNSSLAYKFMERVNQELSEQLRLVSRHMARLAAEGSVSAASRIRRQGGRSDHV